MSGIGNRLDERCELAVQKQQIEPVFLQRLLVIRRHGEWLTPDQRNPLGVGFARQCANGWSVVFVSLSECDFDHLAEN